MRNGVRKHYSVQRLRNFKAGVATRFLILSSAINVVPAPAQDSAQPTAAIDQNSSNAAMLKELEQMRSRIQELEAKLNAQSTGAGSNGAAGTSAAAPENFAGSTQTAGEQALQSPSGRPAKPEPFAYADWTWLTGNPRTKTPAFDSKFFTPEIRADASYIYDFANPIDDTIGGSSEIFQSSEFHVTQLGVGGDFHYDHVRARLMTQFGMYSQTQPRNDASNARGQWLTLKHRRQRLSLHFRGLRRVPLQRDERNQRRCRYLHVVHRPVQFLQLRQLGLPASYVSSNTPWFFNGLRVQIFPSDKLKIEPWLINGWQSYGRFNHRPGVGALILWRPKPWLSIVGNQYGVGRDTLGVPNRTRFHTDDSIQVKYYENPQRMLDRAAFSVTIDAGCESGGGVNCFGNSATGVKQSFLGFMIYNRVWLHNDLFGLTVGGGAINNPGRTWCFCLRSMERRRSREHRTLRKVRAIRSKPGTLR